MALLAAAPANAQEVPGTGSDLGGVGLLEMRNARFRPDGTLEAGASLRHQRRLWFVNFQALPWLETTFRIAERLDGTTGSGMTTDRSFDVKIRLVEEDDLWPAVAIGLQDFIGTGIYGGEYIVASKRFGPLDVTAGMGWGRLGTYNDVQNPLTLISPRFEQRDREVGEGGLLGPGTYFRGEDVSLFGGLEYSLPPLWTPLGSVEGIRAKVEVSGDALRDERGGYPANVASLAGQARSRVNYGVQWSNGWLDIGAGWLYGTDFVFRLSARFDPANPPEIEQALPPAIASRPEATLPDAEEATKAALREAGFRPVALRIAGAEARIAVADGPYRTLAQVAGRVMRAAQPFLPAEVQLVVLSWRLAGTEIARLRIPRAAFEAALRGHGSAEELFYVSELGPAAADEFGRMNGGPGFTWGVEPRVQTILGDPSRTLRWQVAAVAGARAEAGYGFALAGSLSLALMGNLDGGLPSDSQLPHVRSDYARYAQEGSVAIPALYAERIWAPARDLFARVTAGILEPMYSGVSAELLWRPYDKPYALGVDIAQVVQRDYDGGFGTLGYNVTTGQVSLYTDLPWYGLYTVLRAGRYLAGDWGGTIEIGRRFDSGIEVGGFATFTDVPFATFGEGSFDRGIYVRVPLDLFGIATRNIASALIRGVQRDGGQRLAVDNPLWEITRPGRERALEEGYRGFLR
ncbi:YjbH domain-containing protein [Roseomonas sp. AR75]|uniref:YjbH domain-containing protein n=1 Tax=Roseomonas sp. AR75 TaxID=2562311 RepID=UPI00210FE1DD|nr:YjbH domain-containing protein [Roseomonas sp. AR75]